MPILRILVALAWGGITLFLAWTLADSVQYLKMGYFDSPPWRAQFLQWVALALISLVVTVSAIALRGRPLTFVMLPASLAVAAGSLYLAAMVLFVPHGPGGLGPALLVFGPGTLLAALTFWLGITNTRRKTAKAA